MWGEGEAALMRRELGAAVLGKPLSAENLALKTVAILGDEMFSRGWPVGAPLGTFSDIQRRCGVGRPAFRAAMNVLDAQGLIEIRRGSSGGVFVSQPSAAKVSTELLLFLLLSRARYLSLIEARMIVLQATSDALINKRIAPPLEHAPTSAYSTFPQWLASFTGNPALHLIAQLLDDLRSRCGPQTAGSPECGEGLARALIYAIRTGDRSGAESIGRAYIFQDELDPAAHLGSLATVDVGDIFKCDKMAAELAGRLLKAVLAGEIHGSSRIGSLDDLAERYGGGNELSIRQAVRMLEDIGVLRCQRGRTGGVVLASGQQGAIIRGIHYCLAASGATIGDNLEISGFLDRSVPRLLGDRIKDAPVPAGMRWAAMPSAARSHLAAVTNQVTAENQLLEVIGNPVLAVIIRALALHFLGLRFGNGGGAPIRNHMAGVSDMYRGMFAALGRGDTEHALELWDQKAEMMAQALKTLHPA